MDLKSFLLIEKGEPYQNGCQIQLFPKDITIGRASSEYTPDICFNSLYISRKHAMISFIDGKYCIKDLFSTHGTVINGTTIEPNEYYPLNNGDTVSFVNGVVKFLYNEEIDMEKTITLPFVKNPLEKEALSIDVDKKQVWLNGELLLISGKPRDLLILLYENKNQAVSYDEIKALLWNERKIEENTIPDVGNEEIHALVYRLRKQLGDEYGKKIVTVPGYGLVLEL